MRFKSLVLANLLLTVSLFAQDISVTNNWQLLGAVENIDVTQFDGKCVDFVWKYDNGWQIHVSNNQSYDLSGLTKFNTIDKGEGFWIKGNKNCLIETSVFTGSKFDNAKLINLNFLSTNDLKIILDSNISPKIRSVHTNTNRKNINQMIGSLSKIKDLIMKNISKSHYQLRDINDDGDNIISQNTENGNLSGSLTSKLVINKSTGKVSGSFDYSDYSDNSDDTSCAQYGTDKTTGSFDISGIYDFETDDITDMNLTATSDIYFNDGDIILKKSFKLDILSDSENNNMLISMSGELLEQNEDFGLKDFKIKMYSDSKYDYSYPISGNIYIFKDDMNGYFYVDASYDHSQTPIKQDLCDVHTYSGVQKYIGDNSSMVFTVDSTDHYKVDIYDGYYEKIDKTITGSF